jgi:hypothetical protein
MLFLSDEIVSMITVSCEILSDLHKGSSAPG